MSSTWMPQLKPYNGNPTKGEIRAVADEYRRSSAKRMTSIEVEQAVHLWRKELQEKIDRHQRRVTHLDTIDLSSQKIGNRGVECLFNFLNDFDIGCSVLKLYKNDLGDEAMRALAIFLRRCKTPVHEIHLSDTYITEEGLSVVLKAVAELERYPRVTLTGKGEVATQSMYLRINDCQIDYNKIDENFHEELRCMRNCVIPNWSSRTRKNGVVQLQPGGTSVKNTSTNNDRAEVFRSVGNTITSLGLDKRRYKLSDLGLSLRDESDFPGILQVLPQDIPMVILFKLKDQYEYKMKDEDLPTGVKERLVVDYSAGAAAAAQISCSSSSPGGSRGASGVQVHLPIPSPSTTAGSSSSLSALYQTPIPSPASSSTSMITAPRSYTRPPFGVLTSMESWMRPRKLTVSSRTKDSGIDIQPRPPAFPTPEVSVVFQPNSRDNRKKDVAGRGATSTAAGGETNEKIKDDWDHKSPVALGEVRNKKEFGAGIVVPTAAKGRINSGTSANVSTTSSNGAAPSSSSTSRPTRSPPPDPSIIQPTVINQGAPLSPTPSRGGRAGGQQGMRNVGEVTVVGGQTSRTSTRWADIYDTSSAADGASTPELSLPDPSSTGRMHGESGGAVTGGTNCHPVTTRTNGTNESGSALATAHFATQSGKNTAESTPSPVLTPSPILTPNLENCPELTDDQLQHLIQLVKVDLVECNCHDAPTAVIEEAIRHFGPYELIKVAEYVIQYMQMETERVVSRVEVPVEMTRMQ
ncbi:unnamed protein product [Amoebophrya sp. A120]|nr:unnamed protein product [Amoebophrya sp. A120]|eukprot:GSA120T00020067001.1